MDPSSGFGLPSPSMAARGSFNSPLRQGSGSGPLSSPATPRSKFIALKKDLEEVKGTLNNVKETVDHMGTVLHTDVAEACATALGTECNLQWLIKKFEDQNVATRSALRDMELGITSLNTQMKEANEFAEEVYKQSATYTQLETLAKRLKNIESSIESVKESGDDTEARKKLRIMSREMEEAEESKSELSREVHKVKKAKFKIEQELTQRNEAFKALEREFTQFKEKQHEQHERRSKAAQEAWQKRRQPFPPGHPSYSPESEEKPEAKLSITMPSSSSSSSSSFKVPVMKVSPWAPGGEFNKLGLGTGKAPPKPKKRTEPESSSEEYEEGAEEVREAWSKKPKTKKSKESSDEE
jgi:hypothetical protein